MALLSLSRSYNNGRMERAMATSNQPQLKALLDLYKAIKTAENVLRGSLPGAPGMMSKVDYPLVPHINSILAALDKCDATSKK